MDIGLEKRLRLLQERYGEQLLTLLTVLLLLLMFVVAPLVASIAPLYAFGFAIALAIIVGTLVMSASPTAFALMLLALCMNASAAVLRLTNPTVVDIYLVAGGWLIITSTLGFVAVRAVFAEGPVSHHRVVGAVLLYLLIGMTFVALFVFVGLLVPKAFSGIELEDKPGLATSLIYFSFVTLTSVGYGDILPVHPVARSLCNLEAIVGQLYPATLLARLVTLELEGRR